MIHETDDLVVRHARWSEHADHALHVTKAIGRRHQGEPGQPRVGILAPDGDGQAATRALTERRDLLATALGERARRGLTITIGGENPDPRLAGFTLVTASYRLGDVKGVIGVLGPTRMPYDKIVSLVDHTSRLVEGLFE